MVGYGVNEFKASFRTKLTFKDSPDETQIFVGNQSFERLTFKILTDIRFDSLLNVGNITFDKASLFKMSLDFSQSVIGSAVRYFERKIHQSLVDDPDSSDLVKKFNLNLIKFLEDHQHQILDIEKEYNNFQRN